MWKKRKGFSSKSTAEEVSAGIDLDGKVAIVTGSNTGTPLLNITEKTHDGISCLFSLDFSSSNRGAALFFGIGIGKETARVLALRGAKVILACRDPTKGERAALDILAACPGVPADHVEFMALDLASFESIRAFAAAFKSRKLNLHLLILNAGLICPSWQTTVDGYEATFGVNHLGHFLLTSLLVDVLIQSAPARVISVSSNAQTNGDNSVLTIVNDKKDHNLWKAYGNSKLANILFALELNRRFQLLGVDVSANSLHPGMIPTEITRNAKYLDYFQLLVYPWLKTIPQGAATTLFLATHPTITPDTSGHYWSDCKIAHTTKFGTDLDLAAQLWALSENLTSTTFLPDQSPTEHQTN